jgi:hypothetical protein
MLIYKNTFCIRPRCYIILFKIYNIWIGIANIVWVFIRAIISISILTDVSDQ